ncbi:hypothetical protein Q0M94_13920 [Deinococcus radiomollis]
MTVSRPDRTGPPAPENFVPAGRLPILAFLSGVLALMLVAGWLSRLA